METSNLVNLCRDLTKVLDHLHESGSRSLMGACDRRDLGVSEDGSMKVRSGDDIDEIPVVGISEITRTDFDLSNAVHGLLSRVLRQIDIELPETYDPKANASSFTLWTDLSFKKVTAAGSRNSDVSSGIINGILCLREDLRKRVDGMFLEDGELCVWYR